MELRILKNSETFDAFALAWRVFSEFEAPEYPPQGIKTFYDFLHNEAATSKLCVYGAFVQGALIGMLALRGNHISLFFVEKRYHRQGVGGALFSFALQETEGPVTVNSSPYAVKIYRALGFKALGPEELRDGIRFTPMRYQKN